MRHRHLVLLACAAVGAGARAQTIDDLRDSVRRSFAAARYSTFLTTLGELASDGQLSLGTLTVEGEPEMEVRILSLPWRRNLLTDDQGRSLRVELVVGYSCARGRFEDLWSGTLPGLETEVRTRFEAFGADLGLGPDLPVGSGLVLRPLVHVGGAWVENTTYFGGPGAPLASALTDGIVFNWDGFYGCWGGSLAVHGQDYRFDDVVVAPMVRIDVRAWDGLDVDDPALDTDDTTSWLTVRADARGPIGLEVEGSKLQWIGEAGYRRLFGESAVQMGFADFVELGAGLVWASGDHLPVVSSLELSGAVQIGEDVRGWSFGVRATF